MKRIVTLLLLTALSVASIAGNSSTVDLGNKYYKQFDFKSALVCYLKALKHDKQNTNIIQHIADCYRLMNDWPAAKPYYEQLVAKGRVKPQDYQYYAEALRESKNYADAKIYYAKYLEAFPDDSSAREQMSLIDRTQELLKTNVVYEIRNMRNINSPNSEFGVSFYGAADIFFCSNRKPDNYVKHTDSWTNNSFLKIWTAEISDSNGTLRNAKLLPSTIVNRKFHECDPFYNEKMDELVFSRSNYNGRRAFYSADKTVKLKIYKVAYLPDAGKWDGELKEAVPFNSREYSVCHPSMNKRGDTLYFTSDMPGGYGRADIYMSVRGHDGEWGPPANLGPGINTSGDDMFPFIAADGTLYFASTGHIGLGGLDIFSSRMNNGNWSTPRNLGVPINSNMDDFDYVIRKDNKQGYFVSNRPGGVGDDDIYSFSRTGFTVRGITYNAKTGDSIGGAIVEMNPYADPSSVTTGADGSFTFNAQPDYDYNFRATKPGFEEAKLSFRVTDSSGSVRIPMYPKDSGRVEITVHDSKTHQPIDSVVMTITRLPDTQSQVIYTNKEGKVIFTIDTNTKYKVEAYKETGDSTEKYLRVTADITSIGTPPPLTKENIDLEKEKKKVPIKLENIYYDLDKWDIRPDAAIELDKLVKILKDNPTMEIELSSHTDCRGTAGYNMSLSKLRAHTAVTYIVAHGIQYSRVTAAGYGESRLVNKCKCEDDYVVPCTEEMHQANRRTEFKIKKF